MAEGEEQEGNKLVRPLKARSQQHKAIYRWLTKLYSSVIKDWSIIGLSCYFCAITFKT